MASCSDEPGDDLVGAPRGHDAAKGELIEGDGAAAGRNRSASSSGPPNDDVVGTVRGTDSW